MTFAEVAAGAEGYFAQQQKRVLRGKVKPMTVFRAQLAYDLHLEPAFGSLPFSDIDEDAISDWIDDQLEAGAAPKSIRNRRGLLFSVMKHGQMRLRVRPDNPCELPELTGTSQARQIAFFQHGEWALMRSCLRPTSTSFTTSNSPPTGRRRTP
jgi:hypothetical protein